MSVQQDFEAQLTRQLTLLENSCTAFDEGCFDEAIRIATSIRVLIHDTNNSTSLLSHLNSKAVIKLLSSCKELSDVDCVWAFDGLTRIISPGGVQPKFNLCNQSEVTVDEWWNQIVMVKHPHRIRRKDLVLVASNKDGGAHVDKELPANYANILEGLWKIQQGHQAETETKTHLFSLRQMGFELLHSSQLIALCKFHTRCMLGDLRIDDGQLREIVFPCCLLLSPAHNRFYMATRKEETFLAIFTDIDAILAVRVVVKCEPVFVPSREKLLSLIESQRRPLGVAINPGSPREGRTFTFSKDEFIARLKTKSI